MNEVLARRYARLMRMYPRRYRSTHGDEIVDTLLAVARPGQRRPAARETVALAVEATKLRATSVVNGSPVWWLDGLHMATFLLALGAFATAAVVFFMPDAVWLRSNQWWTDPSPLGVTYWGSSAR